MAQGSPAPTKTHPHGCFGLQSCRERAFLMRDTAHKSPNPRFTSPTRGETPSGDLSTVLRAVGMVGEDLLPRAQPATPCQDNASKARAHLLMGDFHSSALKRNKGRSWGQVSGPAGAVGPPPQSTDVPSTWKSPGGE